MNPVSSVSKAMLFVVGLTTCNVVWLTSAHGRVVPIQKGTVMGLSALGQIEYSPDGKNWRPVKENEELAVKGYFKAKSSGHMVEFQCQNGSVATIHLSTDSYKIQANDTRSTPAGKCPATTGTVAEGPLPTTP
jgi:hypothetical protein